MEERLYTLLKDVLGDKDEAMVRVDAIVDIVGDDWLAPANAAALRLNAHIHRPEQASQFALLSRK